MTDRENANSPSPGVWPKPTLQDIAREVGVSVSTVSATLNNAPRARNYSQATKTRIHDVARRLGYRPNPLAQVLKRARSGILGVVQMSQLSMYNLRALTAVEAVARQAGYELVTADLRYDMNRLERCLQQLAAWRAEGFLLMTGGRAVPGDLIAELNGRSVPYLVAGAWNPGDPCSGIALDNVEGGRIVARHLAGLGHDHIGLLAARAENQSSEERLRGMREGLEQAGRGRLHVLRAKDVDIGLHAGYRYAGELLARQPGVTAIACVNDDLAIGAMQCLRERAMRVPEDISVAGHDDVLLAGSNPENRLGAFLSPGLTTIRTPVEQMGAAAARMLIEMVSDERARRTRRTEVFVPELIVRGSTGPPPRH